MCIIAYNALMQLCVNLKTIDNKDNLKPCRVNMFTLSMLTHGIWLWRHKFSPWNGWDKRIKVGYKDLLPLSRAVNWNKKRDAKVTWINSWHDLRLETSPTYSLDGIALFIGEYRCCWVLSTGVPPYYEIGPWLLQPEETKSRTLAEPLLENSRDLHSLYSPLFVFITRMTWWL